MRLSTTERRIHIKLFENNVCMSEKLQGFVLLLPTIGGRMLSMFCLTASYSRIRILRLPYSAYSRFFSSDSLEYSSRSLPRSGSLSPTPAAFSARADASKRMISRSRPRRYFSLSWDFFIRYTAALAPCRWWYALSAAPDPDTIC